MDMQDKIIADAVRYGCKMNMVYEDDVIINSFVGTITGNIDYSLKKYEENVSKSKNRMKVNDRDIWAMARMGKTAQEIADYYGVKKNTIEHKDGWRNRGNDEF